MTREELYEAVWARPLAHLAKDLDTTYTTLTDACARLEVPRPAHDHWSRVDRGERIARVPLPPVGKDVPDTVELRVRAPRRKHPVVPAAGTPQASKDEGPKVDHPLVAQSKAALATAQEDHRGLLVPPFDQKCLEIRVSRPQLERVFRIFNILFAKLPAVGARVEIREGGQARGMHTWIVMQGESFRLHIDEKVHTQLRTPTAEERRRLYSWDKDQIKVYKPSGILTLSLGGLEGSWARRNWADTPALKLEAKLDDVGPGLVAAVAQVKASRAEAERRQREREEEARRAAERQRDLERQRALVAHTFQMRRRWTAASELRDFANAAERAVPEAERDEVFHRWLVFIREAATEMDPLDTAVKAKRLLLHADPSTWLTDDELGVARQERRPPSPPWW